MKTQRALFFGVMVLALIHGTLYLTLVPPWDHYDEPTHFEYGWLIANRLRFPQTGDVDWAIRREIAASMLEQGFQHEHMLQPALLPGEGSAEIGLTELNHPPLYYALIAVPLRLLRYADVRTQLYAARAVSLLLYLVTVACAWGLGVEVTQRDAEKRERDTESKTEKGEEETVQRNGVQKILSSLSSLKNRACSVSLCVPFFLALVVALIPGFADLMTAVNNDVGATAAFSVFLWCAARAIRRRAPSETVRKAWGALIGCTLAALLCPWIKNTAAPALFFLPLVWILALAPPPHRRRTRRTRVVLAVAGALIVCVGLGLVFTWGDAALWYRVGVQETPTRQKVTQAPLGKTALVVGTGTEQLRQFVPDQDVQELRGKTVTLGAWIWSTQPVEINAPRMRIDMWTAPRPERLQIGPEPTFYAVTTEIPDDAPYLFCQLYSASSVSDQEGVTVYYDGVVLAEGRRGATSSSPPGSRPVPAFDDHRGRQGTWYGWRFENRLRNGSAQAGAPYVRPQIERAIQRYARRSPSQLVLSVLDWKRSSRGYLLVAQVMLQTFWATFSWNHVSLPGIWYAVLGAVSLLCLAGAAVRAVRAWRQGAYARRRILVLLALAGIAVWANAVLRIHPLVANVFMPVARYTYPVILPTALALLGGAWALTEGRRRWLRLSLLGGLVVLALFSLWTVAAYPHYRTPPLALSLLLLALCFPAGWALGLEENAERAARELRGLWQRLQAWWNEQDKERLLAYGALVLILLAGLAARALHSTAGLPYMYPWDEPPITHTALQMLKTGDLNPHYFNYGSLLIYANLGIDAVHYLYKLGRPVERDVLRHIDDIEVGPFGPWEATGDYRWYVSHPSFLLWNRMLTVLMGVGSVIAAFALARQIGGLWAGVVAAAFLAGQPYYATDLNSLALPDGPTTALLMAACVLAAAYVRKKRPLYLIGAAAVIGLAGSIKYNSAYSLIVPLSAAFFVRLTEGHRPPWWIWPAIPITAGLTFLVGMPYALLDLPNFVQNVGVAVNHYGVEGHDAYGTSILPGQPNLFYQLLNIVGNLGLVGTLLALVGLPRLARDKVGWMLMLFGGLGLWFLTGSAVRFPRNYAVLYPLLAIAQGCGLVWLYARLSAWLAARPSSRWWPRLARAGALLLIVVSGALYLGSTVRDNLAVKDQMDTRTRAIYEVNALAQELDLDSVSVGIASELQIHPLDLRQIDTELLYQLEPTAALACNPTQYDILVLPRNDGTQVTEQAVHALSRAAIPHVTLGRRTMLVQSSPIVHPGVLITAPPADHTPPRDCTSRQTQAAQEWPPEPLRIGDWEAPIPDRHRPDEIPPQPWDSATACAESLPWLIQEDMTATYSRLQERGQKMQLALRGSVQTAPCRLEPGTYRFNWRSRLDCTQVRCQGSDYALLEVSVWEHPPGRPPERVRTRILKTRQLWTVHYELVQVRRPMPVSVEIHWLNGPGAPHLAKGQPQISLLLDPQVTVQQEPDLSLGRSLVAAWQTTVDRLVWR